MVFYQYCAEYFFTMFCRTIRVYVQLDIKDSKDVIFLDIKYIYS